MDEYTTDAFANRDEPIPVINVSGNNGTPGGSSDSESKRSRLKNLLPSPKLKQKIQDATAGTGESGHSLQDRLFAK